MGGPTGQGYNFRGEKARELGERLVAIRFASLTDEFAELLSEGFTTRQAAERMGKTAKWGDATLGYIRKRLGPQAI